MRANRIGKNLMALLLMAGFMSATCTIAEAKYVKPDPIQIIRNIEKARQETAKTEVADDSENFAANYDDIMERLITIAAEKYGIIFIVQNDKTDFFSSKEG